MADEAQIGELISRLRHGRDEDPDAEWRAAISLGEMSNPADAETAAAALMQVLSSNRAHALTRAHTVEALGNLRTRQAVPALVKALHDSYGLVRAYAARALGKIMDEHAVRPLLACLREDEFFGARAEAAAALSMIAEQQEPGEQADILQHLHEIRNHERDRNDEGSARVTAEIDRSLARLQFGGDNHA